MRKARCTDCGRMGVSYDRGEKVFSCTCGSTFEHHPDLCRFYHGEFRCIYSGSKANKINGKINGKKSDWGYPDPFRDPYPEPFPVKRGRGR